jgi:DNA-binding protein YbaB
MGRRAMSETAGVGVEALDQLLDRTRQALEAAGSGVVSGGSGGLRGEGTAASGQIRATVTPSHVESIRIDPRAMRRGSAELAAQITAAVNEGFAELRRSAGSEDVQREAQARAAALSAKLRDVQNDSMRSMAMIAQALNDAVSQFGRGRD